MRVKDTLNLGKTKFPMRGSLPKREGEWQAAWEENKLYEKRQKLNEGKPTFILHDGPPYANGNIHIGHALNKISKDIIVRFKSMSGFRAPYVPGWDTHGLPIEQQLTKQGYNRKEMSTTAFRELCRKFALEQVAKQKADFKRLGVSGDWDHPYLTLAPEFEAHEVRVFGEMAKKGYIYRGNKPIHWSPSSESALAEAELEYKDIESPSAYYGEKVKDGKGILADNTYFVVWTTTPWTIPASEGIVVSPDYDYSVVKPAGDDRQFVIATELVQTVAEKAGWSDVTTVKTLKGREMERMTATHPFYDRELLVMLGNYVTLDSGTGLVHTAPGLGDDDFNVGKKYGLPILSPVDAQGKLTDEAPGFEGLFYEEANQLALEKVEATGQMIKQEPYLHSYPMDWRTKKPVIFRSTPQWFASVEAFRDEILAAIKEVKFFPDWGETRLYNMIRDRGDWVISRQRVWGVPLPIFYGEDGAAIITPETIDHVANLFAEFGSNVWFDREAKDLLPDGFTSEHSPNGTFTKENDIMDVWFDSGSSHQGVLAERDYLEYPADLYLEGADQYRGWFNSSLITSVAVSGHAPYKQVLSQGFTLDGNGRKMSKSLGNTISPEKIIKQMGAEIIRLWVSTVDSSADVRVSMENMKQVSDSYRKIRNTLRFMLANTTDFEPQTNRVDYQDLAAVDQYLMVRLNEVKAQILAAYNKYDFATVYKAVMNFITVDLSAFYLDFAKDVIYIEAENSPLRRSMQTVMYQVLVDLAKALTPILPHTMEEIWSYLKEPEDYVQLAEMPTVTHFDNETQLLAQWQQFMAIRSDVLKALEEARDNKVIGKSLEAKVTLYPTPDAKQLLANLDANVQQILIVSDLEISTDPAPADALQFDDVAVQVEHAPGEVCPRCRMTRTDVGVDPRFPLFDGRCAKIVAEHYPEAITEGFED
ncbi:isoleucine--tRNA ligase [Loigolactobacillus bifermentans]|uniref:Isoleucine--tRNA ligase n=1 Tax=Loigolactobacillus bifermentans DSM 20003 TaxID=1423726 RepID=A0A0R1H379_9LACO|nr:isoleucine--tRNA ligase [Loigolactobacillus bifermentans]KRK40473.1 isoleucyl-tRNA synthetase [Loigolactobacillus bifermentans DSM 20003]QGG59805.1 isoleucine--tRNA ligase [Loigolactobacillus bifermentans]